MAMLGIPDSRRCFRSTVVLLALLALVSTGSAEPQKGKKSKAKNQPQAIELMWPEPPQMPRVKVVNILASESDLGRKTTFAESLNKFLTGQRPQIAHIYQPGALAVSNDGRRIYAS